jgi:hypothetical protein
MQMQVIDTQADMDARKAARKAQIKEAAFKLYYDLLIEPPNQSSMIALRIANIEAMKAHAGVH